MPKVKGSSPALSAGDIFTKFLLFVLPKVFTRVSYKFRKNDFSEAVFLIMCDPSMNEL